MPSVPPDFRRRCLCALATTAFTTAVFAQDGAAPVDEIALALPGGQSLVFRTVPLGIGAAPFAGREFFMGGRGSEGFREAPMRVMISGSVVLNQAGQPDWCLLFGKTEVTRAQWAAVMGSPAPAAADLPQVGISRAEIAGFIERANVIFKQAGPLPSLLSGQAKLYLRLPDEAEWEFAARGGNAVDRSGFDRRTPYSQALNAHEWFAGASSSNGRLRPVAKLAANPLGLHDMLGNAAEYVEGLYRIEYVHGRNGGLIVRGGNFRTPENQVRSSQRTEVPFCQENGEPYRSDSTGFRLVLGSSLLPDIASIRALETAWNEHFSTRIAPQPSLPANASLAEQTNAEAGEIAKLMDELAKDLQIDSGADESTQAKANSMRQQVASLQARIDKGQQDVVRAGTRMAAFATIEMERKLKRLATIEQVGGDNDVRNLRQNIEELKTTMSDACRILAQVGPNLVRNQFGKRAEEVRTKAQSTGDSNLLKQLAFEKIAEAYAMDYVRYRKLELDAWVAEVIAVP